MRDTLILWDLPAPNEFGSPLEAVEAQISAMPAPTGRLCQTSLPAGCSKSFLSSNPLAIGLSG